MYFEVELEDTIKLKPTYLSINTQKTIEKQLRSNAEGQFKHGYGVLLRVTQILQIGKGVENLAQDFQSLLCFGESWRREGPYAGRTWPRLQGRQGSINNGGDDQAPCSPNQLALS